MLKLTDLGKFRLGSRFISTWVFKQCQAIFWHAARNLIECECVIIFITMLSLSQGISRFLLMESRVEIVPESYTIFSRPKWTPRSHSHIQQSIHRAVRQITATLWVTLSKYMWFTTHTNTRNQKNLREKITCTTEIPDFNYKLLDDNIIALD